MSVFEHQTSEVLATFTCASFILLLDVIYIGFIFATRNFIVVIIP